MHTVEGLFDLVIVNHQVLETDVELQDMVTEIAEKLSELYQAVGRRDQTWE